MSNLVSAVFDTREQAREAVSWLRERGAGEDAIVVVTRDRHVVEPAESDTVLIHDVETVQDVVDHPSDSFLGAGTGAAAGGALGALFGLAAVLVPGPGPFITAGALSSVLGGTGATLASGALVGATAGSIAGAFTRWGIAEEEASWYAAEVESGGTYVGVDVDRAHLNGAEVEAVFNSLRARPGRRVATPENAPPLGNTLDEAPYHPDNRVRTESTGGHAAPGGHYDVDEAKDETIVRA